jgi:hypothetical protein
VTDGICGETRLLASCAVLNNDGCRSKLLQVTSGYCTLDITDIRALTSETAFTMNVLPSSKLGGLYIFVSGKGVTSADTTVKLMKGDGSAAQLTLAYQRARARGNTRAQPVDLRAPRHHTT